MLLPCDPPFAHSWRSPRFMCPTRCPCTGRTCLAGTVRHSTLGFVPCTPSCMPCTPVKHPLAWGAFGVDAWLGHGYWECSQAVARYARLTVLSAYYLQASVQEAAGREGGRAPQVRAVAGRPSTCVSGGGGEVGAVERCRSVPGGVTGSMGGADGRALHGYYLVFQE